MFNLGGSKGLVNQVALFHSGTAVMPPIKGFRCKSIVSRRLSYSNQTLTIGGVAAVVSEPSLETLSPIGILMSLGERVDV